MILWYYVHLSALVHQSDVLSEVGVSLAAHWTRRPLLLVNLVKGKTEIL